MDSITIPGSRMTNIYHSHPECDDNKLPGLILEFGVLNGFSIRQLAKKYPNSRIYGFDSFGGNEVEWCGYKMGEMRGRPEHLPDNVEIIAGRIENTLPVFLDNYSGDINFAHFDVDTYDISKFILSQIKDRLTVGSIILFDEYWKYRDCDAGEFTAFSEFQNENPEMLFSQVMDKRHYIDRRLSRFEQKDYLRIAFKFWRIPGLIFNRIKRKNPSQAFRLSAYDTQTYQRALPDNRKFGKLIIKNQRSEACS
ncbi:MAG: class I SAM-dependent methyltransferase [candidate division Zixibacteria bacterium]